MATQQELIEQLLARVPVKPDTEEIIAAVSQLKQAVRECQLRLILAGAPPSASMPLNESFYALDRVLSECAGPIPGRLECRPAMAGQIMERPVNMEMAMAYHPEADLVTQLGSEIGQALAQQKVEILTEVRQIQSKIQSNDNSV